MGLGNRIKNAWNAFTGSNKLNNRDIGYGSSSYANYRYGRRSVARSTIANTVFNRIALDSSMVKIMHVKQDKETENQTEMLTPLSKCLNEEANIDQTGQSFIHDLVFSMLDEGVIAVVPIETSSSPISSEAYNIYSMRVGRVTQWYPKHVRVDVYNELDGQTQEITLPKSMVAIIENPLYSLLNGDDALLSRILRKMALLDDSDEKLSGDNLNLIVQLPYTVKGETRKSRAKERITDIESQLKDGKRGIAYIDNAEKITQLNHPIASNLQEEITYLTQQFYNALGLTQNVFDGTANEVEMRAYYNRTIDPIIQAIIAEFNRKFLTRTARTQGQRLTAYRDPFELAPVEQLATIADTFSRNAILTPNEIRKIVGFGPNSDPEADKLSNRNIADANQDAAGASTSMGSLQAPQGE